MSNYIKYDLTEPIQVGDLISIKEDNTVVRSFNNYNKKPDTHIIGICTNINEDNSIEVLQQGVVDINVNGIVCIGDKITASNIPGEGCAIRYEQEERMFNIRSIGKVIQLYNDLNKVKVLLDIE